MGADNHAAEAARRPAGGAAFGSPLAAAAPLAAQAPAPGGPVLRYCGTTLRGPARQTQQDAIVADGVVGVADAAWLAGEVPLGAGEQVLLAVVDGIGGALGGAEAAGVAAAELARLGRGPFPAAWTAALEAVSDRVGQAGAAWGLGRMGATAALLVVGLEGVISANIGDCRAYRVDGSHLGQLSVDDSLPGGRPGVVTQSLGGGPRALDAHQYRAAHPPEAVARYLLCSDGLHGFVGRDQILDGLVGAPSPAQAVRRLAAAALAATRDNVSVLVADVLRPDQAARPSW
ncbi:MAG: hypothetical protein LBD51_05950 [Bifidobacteriaceae bacterium]|jgi:serine/threonine protein phosphatase PrpC|nr:hypothetical protein [Bifidobacteriaceae bacterium]